MKTRVFAAGLCTFLVLVISRPSLGQFGNAYPPPNNPNANAPYNPNYNQFYPPTGAVTPQQLPGLANALATEAQQLLDNLRYELYGTFAGRQLEMRAGAVLNAANQVAQNAQLGIAGQAQIAGAMNQFDVAFTELNSVLRSVGGNSPRSSASVDRLQKVAFQIRNMIGAYGPLPGGPPPLTGVLPIQIPGLPCSIRSLTDATANLRIATNNYASFVQNAFRTLADSAQSLNEQVRYFQGLQSAPVQFVELQQSFQQLRLVASDVNTLLGQINPPPQVIQTWAPVLDSLNRVAALLNIPGQLVLPRPGIGGGVIVNPGFPLPGGDPGPGPAFLGMLNQALAESDGFLQGISANASAVPGGFQFVADARNLRGSLLNLNQQVRVGARRRDLIQTMAVAQNYANSINRRIAAVARGRIGPNIARFQDLANMLNQLQGMLN
ncbi:hypothetical protein [Singulisphaera acidiphila]|uniref:Uncharacterized protein n=1 Tax=Singulisphaera acidiphila (strain ATCC BAA-1392 / DSM 18658 / VKM B-2454 / MOB10) TaxID=886293 RepID=L0DEJ7_SINAD|nr:hypothetical protein [Singulisphaera acidiphila]AGA27682.1 hypothetical protein Sinac_3421 [Singulisphaera acidiphila DSM 18658]